MKGLCTLLLLTFCIYSCTSYKPFCPCGWVWSGGKCYKLSSKTANWCYAMADCQANNGYLVKIESKAESDRLKGLAAHFAKFNAHARANGFWIGATDQAAEKKWRWVVDGKRTKFTDWNHGQPDNAGRKEHCAHMWGQRFHFRWNDNRCEARLHYICESRPFGEKPCTCIKP